MIDKCELKVALFLKLMLLPHVTMFKTVTDEPKFVKDLKLKLEPNFKASITESFDANRASPRTEMVDPIRI
jgi:hypothetical protein